MIKRLKYVPFFVVLLPIFYVLHGYFAYNDIVPASKPVVMSLEYMLAGIILAALAFLIVRNFLIACLVSFFLQFGNFYIGLLQDYLFKVAGFVFFTKTTFLLVVYFLIVFVICFWLRKKRQDQPRYVYFLNVLFVFLIAFELVHPLFRTSHGELLADKTQQELATSVETNQVPILPDVFLIVLDEYSGKKTLAQGAGEDNSDFINFLRGRNFFVAEESRANYNSTVYSIATMLNLNYLEPKSSAGEKRSDVRIPYRNIANNFLKKYLDSKGYDFINNGWFSINHAKQLENPSYGPEERSFISSQTVLNRFKKNGLLGLSRKLGLKKVERNIMEISKRYNEKVLENILDQAGQTAEKPRFVYTHFSMPHFPYFFTRDGKEHSLDTLAGISVSSNYHYVEYLLYCNELLKKIVEKLQTQTSRPHLIYIVSDHGNRKMQNVDWDIRAYSSLFAYYDSRARKIQYPEDICNVNIFRYWLQHEFGEKIDMLPDITYKVVFTSD